MRTHVDDVYETHEDRVRVAVNATLELRYHSSHIPDDQRSDLLALAGL